MTNEEKWTYMMQLLDYCIGDPMIRAFFDLDSEKMLDEKIEVLTALKDGKTPGEIPNYYKILELKPSNDQHWDI